jgi:uncharacterized membrane-anchored protein
VWEVVRVERARPADKFEAFLKGRVTATDAQYPFQSRVEYGIESYFVPQGQGLVIQRARDLKVKVAVSGLGEAVIKQLIMDGQPWAPR